MELNRCGVFSSYASHVSLLEVFKCLLNNHTSFFIVKKEISLCYGLGLALVHQDSPFQSIREKDFQKRIKGVANS